MVKNNFSSITTNLQNDLTGFVAAVQPNGSNPGGTTPQAFLTILFFDERFKFIAAADGGVAQQQVASSVTADGSTLVRNDIKAPKNGYAYIYISNQSNQDVFFDNLKVQVVTGNIIEENHYYAYGLKIAAISSKKLADTYEGVIKNNYLYQGVYSEMDDDIGWNDFALRNYDPQIGRWVQQDPYADYYISSSYAGMANDPVNTIDPSGGLIGSGLFQGATQFGKSAAMAILGAVIGAASTLISGDDSWTSVALGAAIGIGASFSFTITGKVVQAASVAATIINTSVLSNQAGSAIEGNQSYSGHGPNAGNYGYDSGPDDYIQVDEKNKTVTITKTDEPVDVVHVDGQKRFIRYDKGAAEKEYREKGYKIEYWQPNPVGMGAVDGAILSFVGGKLTKWFIGKIAGWWGGRAAAKGGTNLIAKGLGSTGRTTAANLTEQLAMKEIMSNPTLGKTVMTGMKDSRWLGWNKMQYTHTALDGTKTTIHYVGQFKNGVLKAVDDFKFVSP